MDDRGEGTLLLLVGYLMFWGFGILLVIANHFFKKWLAIIYKPVNSNDGISILYAAYVLFFLISMIRDKEDQPSIWLAGIFVFLNLLIIVICRVTKIDSRKSNKPAQDLMK
jgi:hypothetical protein